MSPVRLTILLGLPIVGIGILLLWSSTRPPPEPEVQDENVSVRDMESKVPEFTKEYRAVMKLKSENPAEFERRGTKLKTDMETWRDEWNAMFDPKRDENDELPPELQGYDRAPNQVNQLIVDLYRQLGM